MGRTVFILSLMLISVSQHLSASSKIEADPNLQSLPIVEECPICLDDLTDDVTRLACGHEFHSKCIDEWFKKDRSCPTCRKRPEEKTPSNHEAHEGRTPLHDVAILGLGGVFRDILLQVPQRRRREMLQIRDNWGFTAFHHVIVRGRMNLFLEVVAVLDGRNLAWLVNYPDGDGNTPLDLAVIHQHEHLERLLEELIRQHTSCGGCCSIC